MFVKSFKATGISSHVPALLKLRFLISSILLVTLTRTRNKTIDEAVSLKSKTSSTVMLGIKE